MVPGPEVPVLVRNVSSSKEDIQISTKHMSRWPTPLVIKEQQNQNHKVIGLHIHWDGHFLKVRQ